MNLTKIRKAAGLTQVQLAERTNITLTMIKQYEQGSRNINGAAGITLYRLSQALGCKMEDLLELDRPQKIVKLYDCKNSTNPYLVAELEDGTLKCAHTTPDASQIVIDRDYNRTGRRQEELREIQEYQYKYIYKDVLEKYNKKVEE